MLLRLLDEKGLSVVSELHMQLYRFPIDFYINLQSQTTHKKYKALLCSPPHSPQLTLVRFVYSRKAPYACTTQLMDEKNCATDLPEELRVKPEKKQQQGTACTKDCYFQQMPQVSIHALNRQGLTQTWVVIISIT